MRRSAYVHRHCRRLSVGPPARAPAPGPLLARGSHL